MGHGTWGMGHGAWDMGHGAWDMGLGVPPSGPSNQADERQGTKHIEGAENLVG